MPTQAPLHGQSLDSARQAARASAESLERQRVRFGNVKAESVVHLRELCSMAAEESYWEVAALQLEEALRQVSSISTEAPSAPQVPLIITSLSAADSEERIAWLRHLEELHRQRERLETNVQHARNLETTRFQELDPSRNRFQSAQDRFNEALLMLNNTLEQFTSRESLQLLQETMPLQGDVTEDDPLPARVEEQSPKTLNHYPQPINAFVSHQVQPQTH